MPILGFCQRESKGFGCKSAKRSKQNGLPTQSTHQPRHHRVSPVRAAEGRGYRTRGELSCKYLADLTLLAVEEEALNGQRGLWALPEVQRIRSWEWRRGAAEERRGNR